MDGLYREGVGIPLNIPLMGSGEPRVRRPKKDGSNWSKTALPWMSIGYETQMPPIATLTFYNAIANGGKMVRPRFVKAVRKNGEIVREFPVEVIKERICSPKTLNDIQEILEMVVSKGLGKKAGCKDFKVSGKTGTAQVAQGRGGYHGGRMKYLISFAVIIPQTGRSTVVSSRYKSPVCRLREAGIAVRYSARSPKASWRKGYIAMSRKRQTRLPSSFRMCWTVI